MDAISLCGDWKLWAHPEWEGVQPATPAELPGSGARCIPARVPGNVELDLVAAGLEPDPFFGVNLTRYRQYEFYSWWYEREVTLPDPLPAGEALLRFDGLDTYTDIWVNGARVGGTDNMLIEQEIPLGDVLRPGANHIAVHIRSAMNEARRAEFPVGCITCENHGDEFTALRKAPSMFGWDIMPRFVSAGIWKEARLQWRPATHIREVYYALRELAPGKATIHCRYRFATDAPMIDGFTVRITARLAGETVAVKESLAPFVSGKTNLVIPEPRLWWPRGYGDPTLYELEFALCHGGQVVETRRERFGIRQIGLERGYGGEEEQQFLLRVNGEPILCKGANWVPLDAMHSRDAERLERAHALLDDVGCNMVRCWGGNVYESDRFFQLCDERGIMVWQDFAFACAFYNQSDDFARVVEREAAAVIRRLRNHPSLVLWAGDNELDAIYVATGQTLPHARDNRISRELLPRAVMMHDPYREYLPSSPYIPLDMARPDDVNIPEQHNWGPRDYFKGDFYKHCSARFISETGYHGCPAAASLRKFLPESELTPVGGSEAWRAHNTDFMHADPREYDRNQLMGDQVRVLFGEEPQALEEFVLLSQLSQAEAKKFFIENTRIQKWRRTGILWWNLLDGWPQISDAVVDYYYSKKIAYHYIKRVQGELCLIMGESEGWQHRLVLCNDSLRDRLVDYRVVDGDTGDELAAGQVHSAANKNTELPPLPSMPGEQRLYLLYWTADGETGGNHYISGYVPMHKERMLGWLPKIESLPGAFNAEECVR